MNSKSIASPAQDFQVVSVRGGELRSSVSPHPPRQWTALFLGMLSLYCIWILSLPVFPSQDDPMHLYYVDVLHHLLKGDAAYTAHYAIRLPLPPYTGQYLLLLVLEQLLDPVWAEKVSVCLTIVSTSLGFRLLASRTGPSGSLVSFFIFPLTLSWPLFMGFHSFCLSLSFALWALVFWFTSTCAGGNQSSQSLDSRVAFLAATACVVFTHPVPLLFILGVVGVDLAVKLVLSRGRLYQHRADLAWAAAAAGSLGYIALFLTKSQTGVQLPAPNRLTTLHQMVALRFMSLASGGLDTKFIRLALYAVLIACGLLAIRAIVRSSGRPIDRRFLTWPICTMVLVLAFPFFPSEVNGSGYFAERLSMLVWLSAVLAASAYSPESQAVKRAVCITGCVLALSMLALANHVIRPIALSLAYVEKMPPTSSRTALVFPAQHLLGPARANFDPFREWSVARYCRRSQMILLNDPWSTSPNILPITRAKNSISAQMPPAVMLYPELLHAYLLHADRDRKQLFAATDEIVFVGLPVPAPVIDPVLTLDPARTWHCQQHPWFFVCRPNQTADFANSIEPLSPTAPLPAGDRPYLPIS